MTFDTGSGTGQQRNFCRSAPYYDKIDLQASAPLFFRSGNPSAGLIIYNTEPYFRERENNMKKIIILLLAMLLLFTAAVSAEEQTVDPLYQNMIDELFHILDGQDSGVLTVEKDYTVIFAWLKGHPASVNLGYVIRDVDGNGTDELLIGENTPLGETVLYNMFTIRDGELVNVFSGWDRNRYYLCTNGNFINEGSSGAMQSSTIYYIYAKGEMIFIRSVIYDATMEPEGPWFVSYEKGWISDEPDPTLQEISQEKAMELSGAFTYETLELTPFLKK